MRLDKGVRPFFGSALTRSGHPSSSPNLRSKSIGEMFGMKKEKTHFKNDSCRHRTSHTHHIFLFYREILKWHCC